MMYGACCDVYYAYKIVVDIFILKKKLCVELKNSLYIWDSMRVAPSMVAHNNLNRKTAINIYIHIKWSSIYDKRQILTIT